MKNQKRARRSFAWTGTAVVILALAACSSGDSASETASDTVETPSVSTSCEAASASSPRHTPGSTTQFVEAGGVTRDYIVNVPTGFQADQPTPVVLNFHGLGSSSDQQATLTGIEDVSNREGFLAVTLNARNGSWDLPRSNQNSIKTTETAYLKAVTDDLKNSYCVDEQRVYSMGFSQGSAITLMLACSPDAGIAAFGGVGAAFYSDVCRQSKPAPLIYFHGTKDKTVPIGGGPTPIEDVEPAMDSMEKWAKHNECDTKPKQVTNKDVTKFTWQDCSGDAEVIYYRVSGGGHTWPGSDSLIASFLESRLGKTTQTVVATEAMWEFFKDRTLSQR